MLPADTHRRSTYVRVIGETLMMKVIKTCQGAGTGGVERTTAHAFHSVSATTGAEEQMQTGKEGEKGGEIGSQAVRRRTGESRTQKQTTPHGGEGREMHASYGRK